MVAAVWRNDVCPGVSPLWQTTLLVNIAQNIAVNSLMLSKLLPVLYHIKSDSSICSIYARNVYVNINSSNLPSQVYKFDVQICACYCRFHTKKNDKNWQLFISGFIDKSTSKTKTRLEFVLYSIYFNIILLAPSITIGTTDEFNKVLS